jgi:8-oxo-dGTP diphosphatase
MDPYFVGKVALKAVLVRGDRVLITQSLNDPKWEIPGGRLHEGEAVETALLREIQEELGVVLPLGPLFYVEPFIHVREGLPHLLLTYRVDCPEDVTFQPSPEEVNEMRWITKEELSTYDIHGNCLNAIKFHWGMR